MRPAVRDAGLAGGAARAGALPAAAPGSPRPTGGCSPTLLRFDSVYHGHFKCNLRRIVDYPNLWAYTRDLVQTYDLWPTINLEHAKRHYYESHKTINPTGIVPLGPVLHLAEPHGRG